MKKFILLLSVITLTLNSCSSDDDNTTVQAEDSFIGIWTQSKSVFEGNDQPLDDCDRQSSFTINLDGTFTESSYFTNSAGICELDFSDPGTWENLGNNTYKLKYNADEDGDQYEENITITDNVFVVSYDDPYFYYFSKN
ncbi:lipocalin family protein [uncultured Dokdonia sp.]|jgi:hypothetical protein|uniref:lipocalin family protein n=1 Tax=Dokdonia sp. R86516 TaxID=3093856 RepID=UPI0030EE6E08|tara:strand:- start:62548 stop:62964 length:417 start_codon:yes stop_codon:yes gene_type:complete